jgi:hypothetical protein
MTTIFPIEVTCENCGYIIGAVEIGSHNNFPGSMDLDATFVVIEKCPACEHRLDHPEVLWRDDEPATPSSPCRLDRGVRSRAGDRLTTPRITRNPPISALCAS